MRANLDAAAAIVRRDLTVFLSYRFAFLSRLLQPIASLTLFYYVSRLVHVPGLSPGQYFASVAVGLVILEMLTATIGAVPIVLRQEMVAGTFERLVLSPFGGVGGVLSFILFPFLSSAAFGMLTIGLAAALFGLHVEATAPLALFVAPLGALAFAPFVLGAAASVLAVKQAGLGAGFAVTFISLVGGFFFPTHLLPGVLRWTADVQPFTPTLELMRHLVSGTALTDSVGLILLKLSLFAAVLLPVGLWLLRRAIEFSRQRGTIVEY